MYIWDCMYNMYKFAWVLFLLPHPFHTHLFYRLYCCTSITKEERVDDTNRLECATFFLTCALHSFITNTLLYYVYIGLPYNTKRKGGQPKIMLALCR